MSILRFRIELLGEAVIPLFSKGELTVRRVALNIPGRHEEWGGRYRALGGTNIFPVGVKGTVFWNGRDFHPATGLDVALNGTGVLAGEDLELRFARVGVHKYPPQIAKRFHGWDGQFRERECAICGVSVEDAAFRVVNLHHF